MSWHEIQIGHHDRPDASRRVPPLLWAAGAVIQIPGLDAVSWHPWTLGIDGGHDGLIKDASQANLDGCRLHAYQTGGSRHRVTAPTDRTGATEREASG
jgi:hypothetical protein